MADELVTIVDRTDQVIGSMWRKDRTHNDIYRVAALWLTNSSGQILLAKRSLTKDRGAGKWGPAAAGTVAEGETYLQNIQREAHEEIGLTGLRLAEGPKTFTDTGTYRYFCQWYTAILDRPLTDFTLDPVEVAGVKWFARDQLLRELQQAPAKFTPNSVHGKSCSLHRKKTLRV